MKIEYWDTITENVKQISTERNINVGKFTDCIIEGHSIHYPQPLIKTENKLILPTIERFMSLGRGTVYEPEMKWNCTNTNVKKVEMNPVFYFVYNCANYFHWIYDTIPYLYSYFKEKERIPNLKILISPPDGENDLYSFVYGTLALLGITKDDLIFLDKKTIYKTIIIGSSLTHNRMSLDPPHSSVFDIINSMSGIPSTAKRIYISRRTWTREKSDNIGTDYTNERQCVNEDDIVNMLQKYGFEEIFCEDLSMAGKIGLFRNAEIVVGPIGGGLANVLFCKPNTKVVSINSPEFFPINERLKYALKHTDLHMFDHTKFVNRKDEIITGTNALSISGGMNSKWITDLDLLHKLITNII
tara:strand:- start:2998 stop:4068 length:1071 start_codon:yes stop_codon:yes gene_type:complete